MKQSSIIYFSFQCMKALARNPVTATILGREGLVPIMTEIRSKLAETAFGPKLKVAVEVLAALTKASRIINVFYYLFLTFQNS